MGNRSRRPVAVSVIVAMLVGLVAALTGASPAAAAPQAFQLDLVEGELLIRDAEEPYALGQPTGITGQHDTGDGGTGAVTAGSFTSPTISFETEALGQRVFVDATFSQVSPGTATGSIDPEGNVAFRTDLTVDLHIELNNPPTLVQECRATPVSIALDSVAPYDPETGRVTVRDADFSVPPVPTTATCISVVASNVNDLLAGSGHSLTMTLDGDVDLPPLAGCPTITDVVEVSPGESYLGDAVAIAATVVPDPAGAGTPECEDAVGVDPAGSVEFLADGEAVAVADLDAEGRAEVSTTSLPAGELSLTARYRGQAPYAASVSGSPAEHTVATRPDVVADVPPSFQIDGPAEEFTVTVTNSELGSELLNARVDLAISRPQGGGSVTPDQVAIEYFDGSTWVPTPLVTNQPTPLMASTGVPLPPGAEVTQRVRLRALSSAPPNVVNMELRVTSVDPVSGLPAPGAGVPAVGATQVSTAFVRDARQAPTLTANFAPHTLRQGMVVTAQVNLRGATGRPPTGTMRMFLDGQPVPVRRHDTPLSEGYLPSVPVGSPRFEFVLPADARTGLRDVVIEYSGDRFYDTRSVSSTVTVLAKAGAVYQCRLASLGGSDLYGANVIVSGNVPEVAAPGAAIPIRQLDVRLVTDRGDAVGTWGGGFGPSNPVLPPESTADGVHTLSLGFGDLGTGTATAVTFANNVPMSPATRPLDPNPDQLVGFTAETASITVAGSPGEVVPVALDTIRLGSRHVGGNVNLDVQCTPVGEPASLGHVTVAGTTLAVDAPEGTREGDAVTLRAAVTPSGVPGTVTFRDGAQLVGVVAVASDGTASMTTRSLTAGERTLTATFRGGAFTLVSDPVVLEVGPEHECPTFTAEGSGRTVRLVYLTLLRRCPDQGGYDYWTAELDGGTTPERFATSISSTNEAHQVLVDDLYRIVLDRSAEPAGRTFWADRLQSGQRYDQLLTSLVSSPEFSSGSAATNAGFVDRLYERLLEQTPDVAGAAYWTAVLDSGVPRSAVARAFTPLPAIRARLVTDIYGRTLDREPTASELKDASDELRATGSLARVYRRIIATTEFIRRADTLPNP